MRIGYSAVLFILCLCLLAGCTLPAGISFPWDSKTPADTARPDDTVAPVIDPPPVSETVSAETSAPENTAWQSGSDPAETEPEDPAVVLPSLIGQNISVLDTLLLYRVEISLLYTPYGAPAGTIVDASFTGRRTETEFLIDPDTTLYLLVSTGTDLTNVTVDETDKTIYLTFDDGPSPKHTRTVLDILDAYGIKGTFFLVGSSVEKYPELVREINERGHKIG